MNRAKTFSTLIILILPALLVTAGTLDVNPTSRFKGNFGLGATIDGTPTFLTDPNPDADTDVRTRFYIRTTDISLQEGASFTVYAGLNNGGDTWFRVSVVRDGGVNKLNLEARLDNGTFTGLSSGDQPELTNGWHAIEILWQAGSGTGQLQGFLDDTPLTVIENLTNGQGVVDEVRFGSVTGSSTGTGGSMLLDDYDSRRDTHIGLLCITETEFNGFFPDWPTINMIRLIEYEAHRCP